MAKLKKKKKKINKKHYLKILLITAFLISVVGAIYLAPKNPDNSFAGQITINNPYKKTSYSYKGNLHAHSAYGTSDGIRQNNDDGYESRRATGEWYRDHGFDFYTITPHYTPFKRSPEESSNGTYNKDNDLDLYNRRMTMVSDPAVPGILWLGDSIENSIYPNNRKECFHVGNINLGENLIKTFFSEGQLEKTPLERILAIIGNPTKIIQNVNQFGGITIFNHPYWAKSSNYKNESCASGDAANAIQKLKNLTGVEIFNPGMISPEENATNPWMGNSSLYKDKNDGIIKDRKNITMNAINYKSVWDKMLIDGNSVWGFAGDDSHGFVDYVKSTSKNPGFFYSARGRAFIIVNSDLGNPDKNDILDNIKKGNFYSSTPINIPKAPVILDIHRKYLDSAKDDQELINRMIEILPKYAGRVINDTSKNNYHDLSITTVGREISISTNSGTAIKRIIGYKNKTVKETLISNKSHTYTPNGSEKYIRFEIMKGYKEVAWSQPIYINSN